MVEKRPEGPDGRLAYLFEEWRDKRRLGRTTAYEELAAGRIKTYTVGRRRYTTPEWDAEWQRAREAVTQQEAA